MTDQTDMNTADNAITNAARAIHEAVAELKSKGDVLCDLVSESQSLRLSFEGRFEDETVQAAAPNGVPVLIPVGHLMAHKRNQIAVLFTELERMVDELRGAVATAQDAAAMPVRPPEPPMPRADIDVDRFSDALRDVVTTPQNLDDEAPSIPDARLVLRPSIPVRPNGFGFLKARTA